MRKVFFKGASLTLVGRSLKLGATAPQFKAITGDLNKVVLPAKGENIEIVTSFPSLDTPVCDLQVKEFNKKAESFSSDVRVIGVSKDLPFAQKKFCQLNNIHNLSVVSDYRFSSFGINYGLLIKELNLLARAIIIVDKSNIIRYMQLVEEITTAPDYQQALQALSEVLVSPYSESGNDVFTRCTPCEKGAPALPSDRIGILMAQHRGWELIDDKRLHKAFKFKDFLEAKYFFDLISILAEDQWHHLDLSLSYNKLDVFLTTHASGGLTDNDFIMAGLIDELGYS
jgi:thioredoxin-dependent peroxiredoxin